MSCPRCVRFARTAALTSNFASIAPRWVLSIMFNGLLYRIFCYIFICSFFKLTTLMYLFLSTEKYDFCRLNINLRVDIWLLFTVLTVPTLSKYRKQCSAEYPMWGFLVHGLIAYSDFLQCIYIFVNIPNECKLLNTKQSKYIAKLL